MSDIISSLSGSTGFLLSTIVSIISLGTGIYKAVHWLNEQNEKKAAIIKKEVEERAEQLRIDNEEKAAVVKRAIEDKATEIKKDLEETTRTLNSRMDNLNTTLTKMLEDLRKRADLTNGNVGDIREDLVQIDEQVQELYEMLEDSDTDNTSRQKTQDKLERRKVKRRDIKHKRESQAHGVDYTYRSK